MFWSVGPMLQILIRYCFCPLRSVCKYYVFLPKLQHIYFSFLDVKAFIVCARFAQDIKVRINKVYHLCVSVSVLFNIHHFFITMLYVFE